MNDKIKVLLVDDEYLALSFLESYLTQISDIEIIGKATSGIQALEILNRETVDLLFLDIQMPILSGINLIKTLDTLPSIILTTAYSDYAVEAFELKVDDYLLKPYSFERLLKSIQKIREKRHNFSTVKNADFVENNEIFLNIKTEGRLVKLKLDDILYIESLGEHVYYVTSELRLVSLQSLKKLEEELSKSTFVRVHKSFIVNKNKVFALEGNMIEVGKFKIPISREKRERVLKVVFGDE
jgi:DNA-binding LytR/AlgR family response regulator